MCVMIYLKNNIGNNEFVVSDTMASADYIGIMRSAEHAPEIIEIKTLISIMESANNSDIIENSQYLIQNFSDEKPHTLDYLKKQGVEDVISSAYTLSALTLFKRYGFNAYKAVNGQWEDNLACYFNSELKLYDYYQDNMGQGCMSNYGSC